MCQDFKANATSEQLTRALSRDTGVAWALVPKKLQLVASINDYSTLSGDCTAILCNVSKATFDAISNTYHHLTLTSRKRPCSPSLPMINSLTM
ncbi:40S ribosomal protein S2 [Camelus dromedarius]|uniref:40S ribosomal protein S2 n=1 Tax=Camelus dromedarius TaxID=9838 RepID=A0A5N4E410_CAMDR|nr:40S ribosomal protein S2 [Camelus dromedarius]